MIQIRPRQTPDLPEALAVYGFSAGGTLAAYAAARGWPDAAVVESAPIDLVTWPDPGGLLGSAGLATAGQKARWIAGSAGLHAAVTRGAGQR